MATLAVANLSRPIVNCKERVKRKNREGKKSWWRN